MTIESTSRPGAVHATRTHLLQVAFGAFAMFVLIQGGVTLLIPYLDLTWSSAIVSLGVLTAGLAFEHAAYGRGIRSTFAALGWRAPRIGPMLAAVVISAAMLAFFPVYAFISGVPIGFRSDWLWVLVGAIALNGLAEETLFRGFVFGHLRTTGLSFRRAGAISLVIFAAVHLYLFVSTPPVLALLATVLAVAAGFPFAFLYERAGMAIWPGVVLHVTAHAYRLLDIPSDDAMSVASVWLLVQLLAVFGVFAFRNTLLRETARQTP